MIKKATGALLIIVILFLAFVSTRKGQFYYERSGIVKATPQEIFPYISNFRLGEKWSPYEKIDPNMKKTFSGPEAQVGSVMEFDGNSNAGSGKLEILKLIPNEMVEIKLTMTKPFAAENIIQYRLVPNTDGTQFIWSMSGDGGFLGKLINVFIDCEKMVGDQFVEGIHHLQNIFEKK